MHWELCVSLGSPIQNTYFPVQKIRRLESGT